MRRLLIRPGGIGDCLLCLPAMECLVSDYTEVWIPSNIAPLVRFADRVRGLSSTGIDLVGLPGVDAPPRTIAALKEFDSVISWYGANRPKFREIVAALALPFRFFPALPDKGNRLHAADYFLRLAGCDEGLSPRIECARNDGAFAVIHPFSGSSRKNWPLERFHEVSSRLPIPVEWSAGPEEILPKARRFADLYQLACWLAHARVYIGNDSGITHLAAAVGTPVVAIFGPTDPAFWGPRGKNVRILRRNGGWPDADEAIAAAAALL